MDDEAQKLLEYQNRELIEELRRLKGKPTGRIGYLLIIIGLFLLTVAVIYSHNISAFIGIALIFWGILLYYIRPNKFVRKEVLDAIAQPLESYSELIKELGYEGTPQYISPSTVWGLRNTILYIPKSDDIPMSTDIQLSNEEILIDNPKGIRLTPRGQGLSRLIEDEFKTDLSTVNIQYLLSNLEQTLVEGLEIAETFQMEHRESLVHVKIKGSIFYETIEKQIESKKYQPMCDPLNSAIACILSRSTRKPVVIENTHLEPREKTVETDFKLLEWSKRDD